MERFEYKIIEKYLDENELNSLGSSGWKLLSYNYDRDYKFHDIHLYNYIFIKTLSNTI